MNLTIGQEICVCQPVVGRTWLINSQLGGLWLDKDRPLRPARGQKYCTVRIEVLYGSYAWVSWQPRHSLLRKVAFVDARTLMIQENNQ